MGKGRSSDDLAVVKAAAWAWYERSSCPQGKLVREIDLSAKNRPAASRPSRYKLEAMKTPGPPVCNSLLDANEIESISRRLDHFLDSRRSSNKFEVLEGEEKKKKKKKEWKMKRPSLRPAVLCGAASDVDMTALRVSRRAVRVAAVK